MIVIEKGIPYPTASRELMDKLDEMEIGDSFEIPASVTIKAVHGAIQNFYRKHGYTRVFSAKKWKKSYRCWRVQ